MYQRDVMAHEKLQSSLQQLRHIEFLSVDSEQCAIMDNCSLKLTGVGDGVGDLVGLCSGAFKRLSEYGLNCGKDFI